MAKNEDLVPFTRAEADTMRALSPVLIMRRDALTRAIDALCYLRDTEEVGEAAKGAIERIVGKYEKPAAHEITPQFGERVDGDRKP